MYFLMGEADKCTGDQRRLTPSAVIIKLMQLPSLNVLED